MKRYNIGIDIDGVLADFVGAARLECQSLFAGRPDDSLIQTTWAFESLGITADEEKVLWRYIDNTPNWWLGLRRMPNTDVLAELVRNHRCIFITNRKDGTGMPIEEQSASWLRANYGLDSPTVLISDNKGPVGYGLNLDYYIDDRDRNVIDMRRESPKTNTYLKSASYNIHLDLDCPRALDFDSFAKMIIRASHDQR